jgi:hypothetical protein
MCHTYIFVSCGVSPQGKEFIMKKEKKTVIPTASAFKDRSDLTSVIIQDGVTCIEEYAFYGCSNLTSVVIPDSVTSIGEGAFRDCTGLTSVVIPDSVTSIEDYAFCGCSNLTNNWFKTR